jgi:hypothetical protein
MTFDRFLTSIQVSAIRLFVICVALSLILLCGLGVYAVYGVYVKPAVTKANVEVFCVEAVHHDDFG